ncbi:MAG: carbamoyltransferase [Chitinophagales bacterium]
MKILGISAYYHDAAVCLVEDGVVVYAAQEERFTRVKNDENFPSNAIINCFEFCKISLSDIDAVVFYEKPFLKFERILETYLQYVPKGLFSFILAMNTWTGKKLFIKSEIRKELKKIAPDSDSRKMPLLLFSEHHLSHAASAFFASPFEQAAILTIDGVGEFATTSLAIGNKKEIQILKEIHFPHSLGLLYSSITYFLGFKVNSDEYKVMGLAAYGNPASEEVKQFVNTIENTLISIQTDGSYHLNMEYFSYPYALRMVDDKKWGNLFGLSKRQAADELTQSHCNLAFAFQKVTEKAVRLLCGELKKITQSDNLCLAGGVALNGVINGIIQRSNLFSNLFIQPASGDAGGALGAALAAYHIHFRKDRNVVYPDAMQNSLLGNAPSAAELDEVIKKHPNHFVCNDEDELCQRTAALVAEGKVVGWFQGRMEFGPRALGNRSIIGDARNTEMQKHLNLKIKNRESFRPFAPAVLEEDVSEYFDFSGRSPYMLQVHPVKAERRKLIPENYNNYILNDKLYFIKSDIPAVTHVDFSVRIQSVNKEHHPLFWKLIQAFKQQTGYGMLINTSFNIKDEPIVCTPEDAYRCFMNTGMDILVLENVIFYK